MHGIEIKTAVRAACAVITIVIVPVSGGSALSQGQPDQTPTGAHTIAQTQAAAVSPVDVYKACLQFAGSTQGHPEAASVEIAGWASVPKLADSLQVGLPVPAVASNPNGGYVQAAVEAADGNHYSCEDASLDLTVPPVTATFTAFGAVPVTATVRLNQVAGQPITAVIFSRSAGGSPDTVGIGSTAVATADLALQVSAVTVDGAPLAVGSNCRAAGILTSPGSPYYNPAQPGLVLTGGSDEPGAAAPQYNNVVFGGGVTGSATVPPFTGCGAAGELDPLLDAAVSGPGVPVTSVLSPLCSSLSLAKNCVPGTTGNPVPTELYQPYWNVPRSGSLAATATAGVPLTITQPSIPKLPVGVRAGATITCPNTALSGSVSPMAGAPRGDLGTVHWSSFGTCTGSDSDSIPKLSNDTTWSVSEQGTARVSAVEPAGGEPPGSSQLRIDGITLVLHELTGTDGDCTATISGSAGAVYDSGTDGSPPTLSMQLSDLTRARLDGALQVDSSSCADEFAPDTSATPTPGGDAPSLTAGYQLTGGPLVITGFTPAP